MSFLFNEKGEMILAQRSHTKSLWGLYWDSAIVSHILKGETPESASNRRGKEELGVDVSFKDIGAFYYTLKYKEDSENEYCHVLVGQTNEIIVANPVEIEDVKVLKMDEVKKFYESEKYKFTPWFKIAWDKFYATLNSYAAPSCF
jgi:isopentenyl-diphosphate delta-isomerase